MIQHEKTLISEDILEKKFLCDLNSCKGACCVEGEWGAPLEEKELEIMESALPQVEEFMSEEGKELMAKRGFYEKDSDGELVTTCRDNGACVFEIKEDGISKCSIEKAHQNGETDFKKPISCHLYPIRTKKLGAFTALNYNDWSICSPACKLGESLSLPVYEFLEEALIRKFGSEWMDGLMQIAEDYRLLYGNK